LTEFPRVWFFFASVSAVYLFGRRANLYGQVDRPPLLHYSLAIWTCTTLGRYSRSFLDRSPLLFMFGRAQTWSAFSCLIMWGAFAPLFDFSLLDFPIHPRLRKGSHPLGDGLWGGFVGVFFPLFPFGYSTNFFCSSFLLSHPVRLVPNSTWPPAILVNPSDDDVCVLAFAFFPFFGRLGVPLLWYHAPRRPAAREFCFYPSPWLTSCEFPSL